jgi:hypothetical protein
MVHRYALLLTDVADSTSLTEQLGDAWPRATRSHITAHSGRSIRH